MVKYLNNVNPSKIIILVSDKDIKDLNYFRKVNGIDFEIFLVEKDKILIPMEKYNIPYFFVLTSDGCTNSVFIPEKNENRFSEQYYNIIKKVI